VTQTLTIPARFNGPPTTANGGYTCGRLAGLLGDELVEVTLRAPPPLGRALPVEHEGDRVELRDGETLVAEAVSAELLMDVPDAISLDEADAAVAAGSEHWTAKHPFPTCVVCGPKRRRDDGFRIFPGALPDRDGHFGASWTPGESVATGDGCVRPECVWAALDCPTSAPVANFGEGPPLVLARLTARLACPVRADERHTILSWPLSVDGRKRQAAAALFDSEGRLLCASRALWIELRQ
jgi:hypothetical protein